MDGSKGYLTSLGILGGSLSIGSGTLAGVAPDQVTDSVLYILTLTGYLDAASAAEVRPHLITIVTSTLAIIAAIGGIMAFWGRKRATKQISGLLSVALCCLLLGGCSATGERTIYIGTIDGDLTVRAVGSNNQGRPTDGFIVNASGEIPLAALGLPGVGSIPINLGMITPPAVDSTQGIYADRVGGSVTIETIGSGNQLFDSIEAAALQDKSSNTNLGGYEAKWAPPEDTENTEGDLPTDQLQK